MIRLPASLVAAVLALNPYTLANPVVRNDDVKIDYLLYHDESLVKSSMASKAAKIERITYTAEDLADYSANMTLSSLPLEQKRSASKSKRWVIGDDDRVVWTGEVDFPGAAVGRITWSNGVLCTGALVGPRHVLTAKHCIQSGAAGEFAPAFDNRDRFGRAGFSAIATVTVSPELCAWKNDWAVIILNRRMGDELGYFGVKLPERAKLDKPIFTHQGYPGDRDGANRPYRQTRSTIHSKDSLNCDKFGHLRSDTDAAGGQSGGPLWESEENGNHSIWAVMAGGEMSSEWTVTTWGSGDLMVGTVQRTLQDFA